MRRSIALVLTAHLILTQAAHAQLLCGTCMAMRPPTLGQLFEASSAVVTGHVTGSREGKDGLPGSVDLHFDKVLKDDGGIGAIRDLSLEPYREIDASHHLFLLEKEDGRYRILRAFPTNNPAIVRYAADSLAARKQGRAAVLRHGAAFLNDADPLLASDAHGEFEKASTLEVAEVGKTLAPEKLARWLQDPKTPISRIGLFASLLGHCGKAEHAPILRKLLEERDRSIHSTDSLLFGLVLLEPKNWDDVNRLMLDPKQDFQIRYSAYRTTRLLGEMQPEVVAKSRLVDGLSNLMLDPDMADFAIDQLRAWKRWELTKTIVDRFDTKGFTFNVTKRAILRFAIQSPEHAARTFVAAQRVRDETWVSDTEELLALERPKSK
jgi:hypothetical protein